MPPRKKRPRPSFDAPGAPRPDEPGKPTGWVYRSDAPASPDAGAAPPVEPQAPRVEPAAVAPAPPVVPAPPVAPVFHAAAASAGLPAAPAPAHAQRRGRWATALHALSVPFALIILTSMPFAQALTRRRR